MILFIGILLGCNTLAKDCCVEEGMRETCKTYEGV